MRFEYMKICSFLWAISLCQWRIHISQQIWVISIFHFSFFQQIPKLDFLDFNRSPWFTRGPWGPRTPGDPQNRFLSKFEKNPKIIKNYFFHCLHRGLFYRFFLNCENTKNAQNSKTKKKGQRRRDSAVCRQNFWLLFFVFWAPGGPMGPLKYFF